MPDSSPFHSRTGLRGDRSIEGFTLVELLVVVGIIALMMALMVFYTTGTLESRKMSGALNEVANMAMLARLEAAKRRSVVYLAFGPRDPRDSRSFHTVAVLAERRDPQTGEVIRDPITGAIPLEYVTRWHRLPMMIFIDYDGVDSASDSVFDSTDLKAAPYPGGQPRDLPVIAFFPDGALDPAQPGERRIVLRVGTRAADTAPPDWRPGEAAEALKSTVEVDPFTGRATVVRDEAVSS